MLELGLVPKQGNAGGRFFPHSGYLGVSPVTIAGTAVAKLPQLCQPLPVKAVSVVVRCYETRTGGPFGQNTENVLWEKSKRLWEPPGSDEFADMGDWECPFRISIPTDAITRTHSSQWTKEWKLVWRLDVVIDHKPIPYVGHRISKAYALNLQNHRTPSLPPLSPPSPISAPGAQIHLNAPHGAFGPGDVMTVSMHVKPDDPATSIKKATVILERRTEFLDPSSSSTPQERRDSLSVESESTSPPRAPAFWRRSVSPRPPYQRLTSDPPSPEVDPSSRVVTTKVIETTCEETTPGSAGTYWCSTQLTIPNRGGKWDSGETLRSPLVSVHFDLRVKVTFRSSKRSSPKEFTCPPVPVILVATSAAERSEAQAFAALTTPSRAASVKRKHRSSRRGLYMHEGTTEISDPIVNGVHTTQRRRRTKSQTSSPVLQSVPSNVSDIKPILLSADHPAQSHNISFVFPSPLLHSSPQVREDIDRSDSRLPSIQSLLSPQYRPPSPLSTTTSQSQAQIDYDSISILRQFQQTGRRISTSTSEEEEMQPSRSRQKVRDDGMGGLAVFERPALPSLDALGLGLPQIPEHTPGRTNRPRTAPVHSTFAMAGAVPPPLFGSRPNSSDVNGRPRTSASRFAGVIVEDEASSEGTFAFKVRNSGP
ncbi:hypothetical protein JCM24511_07706 [Saitozyma sp. JCM 24511]|nr:hypothetical protein JCM24511_07706 [Saitozyma sp. JCM 24511]